ncbi:MAG: hypothetical protein M1142_06540, partial [Patescibacteria group bacterium]|nr:hypothetical protein [Patescibacteria group bacterium]
MTEREQDGLNNDFPTVEVAPQPDSGTRRDVFTYFVKQVQERIASQFDPKHLIQTNLLDKFIPTPLKLFMDASNKVESLFGEKYTRRQFGRMVAGAVGTALVAACAPSPKHKASLWSIDGGIVGGPNPLGVDFPSADVTTTIASEMTKIPAPGMTGDQVDNDPRIKNLYANHYSLRRK